MVDSQIMPDSSWQFGIRMKLNMHSTGTQTEIKSIGMEYILQLSPWKYFKSLYLDLKKKPNRQFTSLLCIQNIRFCLQRYSTGEIWSWLIGCCSWFDINVFLNRLYCHRKTTIKTCGTILIALCLWSHHQDI